MAVFRRHHGRRPRVRKHVVWVPLSSANSRVRLKWCRDHRDWNKDQWMTILFSDESRFSLTSHSDHTFIWGYAVMQPNGFETLSSKIQKEKSLFENEGKRVDYLERTYTYLMTIKPTSVESERAFSSAGQFVKEKEETV
ncbi:transposable element Tcb1 transposase [Trichonephila clavipes]|uniref:Transposable element Tcb1 transposase n=1 Tax=Trichonephila clavipes TaxID=2585209 RepID=A0A8X6W337_TRICX|nr:transposable element Tcb1 transposase [Trichonephila clavipes]